MQTLETDHFYIYHYGEDSQTLLDVVNALEGSFTRLVNIFAAGLEANKVDLSERVKVTIYPNQQAFHQAINYHNPPDWIVGTASGGHIKIVSPANPGPSTNYDRMLTVVVHEFVHIVVNAAYATLHNIPEYLSEGLASYYSFQARGLQNLVRNAVKDNNFPDMNTVFAMNTSNGAYSYGHAFVEYVVEEYGTDTLLEYIQKQRIETVFDLSLSVFNDEWLAYLVKTYLP